MFVECAAGVAGFDWWWVVHVRYPSNKLKTTQALGSMKAPECLELLGWSLLTVGVRSFSFIS